jgi:hypothetical protein
VQHRRDPHVDRYQGFTTGAVFLDDFVPYTKAG